MLPAALALLLVDCPMAAIGVILVIANALRSLLPKLHPFADARARIVPSASVGKLWRTERVGQHRRDDDASHSLADKAARHGYVLEAHEVRTADGYLLTMHRIPRSLQEQRSQAPRRTRVAFVQHGLKSSSADWLMGAGFAFALADRGYDVWMGNFRGNKFARRHLILSSRHKAFWDFSWDEHGNLDLPAMLDYVRAWTGVLKVDFFGHSMGTTALFVMLNMFPGMARHIGRCVAMAPVTQLAHVHGMPSWFFRIADAVARTANRCHVYSIDFSKKLPGYSFVATLIIYVMGYHHIDLDNTQEILSFSPAGCSTENMRHFISCYKSGKFQSRNTEIVYSLSKVHCPIEIWWSQDDWAAGEKDVMQIAKELPNVVSCRRVEVAKFGHLDFMWSSEAKETLYRMMLDSERAAYV